MSDTLADTAKKCQAHLAYTAMASFSQFSQNTSMAKYAENRIRELMRQQGVTFEQLTEIINEKCGTSIHHTTIDKLAKSKMGLTLDWMIKLANGLGVSPRELFEHPEANWFQSESVMAKILAVALPIVSATRLKSVDFQWLAHGIVEGIKTFVDHGANDCDPATMDAVEKRVIRALQDYRQTQSKVA